MGENMGFAEKFTGKIADKLLSKYLIAAYVLITFLVAGFAKADQFGVDAQLVDVSFEKSSLDFLVTGTSENGCAKQVYIAEQKGPMGEKIEFRVIEAQSLEEMCFQRITQFSKRIPVQTLVIASNLQIKPDQVYSLSVVNSPVTVEVLGSELIGR